MNPEQNPEFESESKNSIMNNFFLDSDTFFFVNLDSAILFSIESIDVAWTTENVGGGVDIDTIICQMSKKMFFSGVSQFWKLPNENFPESLTHPISIAPFCYKSNIF